MSKERNTASAWREPMVWLVVAGPAAVVLASLATVALAVRHPDPPLATQGAVPAHAARNHAATGGVPGARP
jgi:uncharacterized protein